MAKLSNLPYVCRPAGTSAPHFRAVIPTRLRPYANGLTAFKRSLGEDANLHHAQYLAHLNEWRELRTRLERAAAEGNSAPAACPAVRTLKLLTEADRTALDEFASAWQTRALEWHEFLGPTMTDDELDEMQADLETRRDALQKSLRRMLPPPEWAEEVAGHLEEILGIRLDDTCPDKQAFLMRLLGEELAAVKATLGRFQGEYIPTPPLPDPAPEDNATAPLQAMAPIKNTGAPGHTLQQCLDSWLQTSGKKTKTNKEFSGIFSNFVEHVGGKGAQPKDVSVQQINGRRHIIQWLEHTARTENISQKTLKKKLAAVSAILGNAVSRGDIEFNPALGIKLSNLALKGTAAADAGLAKDKKHPFAPEEITKYFSHVRYWLTDARVARPVSYWFPLLLFALGMRPEEVATLMRDDIRIDADGRHWIHIYVDTASPNGLPRRPKHNVSIRHLPIPEKLMQLGFAAYVKTIPAGHWLFPCQASAPAVGAESEEDRARYTLKHLGTYLRRVAGIHDPKKVTYSLRHSLKDEMRRQNILQQVSDAITGHAGPVQNAGAEYYGSVWYPEEPLVSAFETLQHLELLPADFPSWEEFRDAEPPATSARKIGRPRRHQA